MMFPDTIKEPSQETLTSFRESIEPMLSASTAHLQCNEYSLIEELIRAEKLVGMIRPEGSVVHLLTALDKENGEIECLSDEAPNFVRLGLIAASCGCHWLMLDQAASVHPGLPVFEW